MKYKIPLFVLLNILIFSFAGKMMYDNSKVSEDQVDSFLKSISNEKSVNFFPVVQKFLKNYKCLELDLWGKYPRFLFYNLSKSKVEPIKSCESDIKITLNDHSISSAIYGSYNLPGIVISEFLTGNLKIGGLKISNLL